jgi:hypothetical protein
MAWATEPDAGSSMGEGTWAWLSLKPRAKEVLPLCAIFFL